MSACFLSDFTWTFEFVDILFVSVQIESSARQTRFALILFGRSPVTHKMRPWVVKLFIQILPKVLFIERPKKGDSIDEDDEDEDEDEKHGEILSGVFDVPSEIDKYLGYNRGYSFDYDVPPPLPPASRYCGARAICAPGGGVVGAGAGVASAVSGSNDTVVNMASDEDEDAIELDEAEDEYDDMFSPTTTTDDGLASPTFDAARIGHHHHQHVHGCPVDQRLRHDPAMQTIQDAKFIAQHVKNQDKFDEASFSFVSHPYTTVTRCFLPYLRTAIIRYGLKAWYEI